MYSLHAHRCFTVPRTIPCLNHLKIYFFCPVWEGIRVLKRLTAQSHWHGRKQASWKRQNNSARRGAIRTTRWSGCRPPPVRPAPWRTRVARTAKTERLKASAARCGARRCGLAREGHGHGHTARAAFLGMHTRRMDARPRGEIWAARTFWYRAHAREAVPRGHTGSTPGRSERARRGWETRCWTGLLGRNSHGGLYDFFRLCGGSYPDL